MFSPADVLGNIGWEWPQIFLIFIAFYHMRLLDSFLDCLSIKIIMIFRSPADPGITAIGNFSKPYRNMYMTIIRYPANSVSRLVAFFFADFWKLGKINI